MIALTLLVLCMHGYAQAHKTPQGAKGNQPTNAAMSVAPQQANNPKLQGEHEKHIDAEVRIVSTPAKDGYDEAAFWINVALAVVGAAGVAVAICTLLFIKAQVIEMRRQRIVMQRTLTSIKQQTGHAGDQTEILWGSVAVAKASADAAQRSIDLTILKEQARVKVRIGDLSIVEVDGGIFLAVVKIEVFNFGATKAFIGSNHCAFCITDSETPYSIRTPNPLTGEPVIHATEKPIEHILRFFITDDGSDAIRALNMEKLFAHLYGMISYTDVFGRTDVIRFRYLWSPNQWAVAAQTLSLTSKGALDESLYGEWQKYGDEKDNSGQNPN